jgi:hypothetical protein
VSVVHHALQALNGQLHRKLPAPVAALICCLALLGGCGGSSHSKTRVAGNTTRGVGASISLDNCTDWQKGTIVQRRDTVLQLREFAGGPVGSSAGIQIGPVLSDDRAYKLFQSYCAKYLARGFKLYKLYERAAAFVGH